jgi:hypothetical protein
MLPVVVAATLTGRRRSGAERLARRRSSHRRVKLSSLTSCANEYESEIEHHPERLDYLGTLFHEFQAQFSNPLSLSVVLRDRMAFFSVVLKRAGPPRSNFQG